MTLPHGALLVFAKKVFVCTEDYVVVECVFPCVPTLAMFLEAAAQCTSGFNTKEDVKMGFLTMGKDVKRLDDIVKTQYQFKVYKNVHIAQYHQFDFEALCKETGLKVVSGSFTLQIKV